MRKRIMNNIEKAFYDAFQTMYPEEDSLFELEAQKPIGIYVPDFIYGPCVIEIDGHESHKTKEQREKDYKRERYFLKEGYTTIRFMATEVFLDAVKCIEEMSEIALMVDEKCIEDWDKGYKHGYERGWEEAIKSKRKRINKSGG